VNSPEESAEGAPLITEAQLDAFFTNPGQLAQR